MTSSSRLAFRNPEFGGVEANVAALFILEINGVGDALHEVVEKLALELQLLAGLALPAPHFSRQQLALDGGVETHEVVLAHIVFRAGSHQLGGGLLADNAGDEDHGGVWLRLRDNGERAPSIELRQVVIAKGDIPLLSLQRRLQLLGRGDALVA